MVENGGNIIKTSLDLNVKQILFSDNDVYFYSFYNIGKSESLDLDFLNEYTVFVKSDDADAKLNLVFENEESVFLNKLDSIDVKGMSSTVFNKTDKDLHILVAGIRDIDIEKPIYHIIRSGDIKKVFKPWGHELWINKYNESYSLKEVFLKEKRRTSLQYHNFKQETNVLFKGTARMWYKSNKDVSNDDVADNDISFKEIHGVASVDVTPKVLHRVESITDVLLYEASTPHLDDVIRVQDDNKRENGTIQSEHQLQVCILAAGIGSRMGGLTETITKALLPIQDKAVISHIIEKFPATSKFVVAVGYKAQQVKDYLLAAYPKYDFEFVVVDNYDKPGSGPGYSLQKCKAVLAGQPFYFSVSDALYSFDIPFDLHENWVGVTKVNYATSQAYCNFTIEENKIINMINKEPYPNDHSKSFTGLAYIHTVDEFWKGIEDNYLSHGEHQMTNGLLTLINQKDVKPLDVNWVDIGSYEKYIDIVEGESKFNFNKLDEYLYFVNDNVVKFFKNSTITKNRIKKARLNSDVFPKIEHAGEQFYSYKLLAGNTMYKKANLKSFKEFLAWMQQNLWKKTEHNISQECTSFYKDKTLQRVNLMLEKYSDIDLAQELVINGEKCQSIQLLLEKIDWEYLSQTGLNSLIHGDLQFDNILMTDDGDFKLIDWRQDFAGLIDGGDIYYDLAKLYGGLIMNYDLIKENYFSYHEEENKKLYDFYTRNSMKDYIEILEGFIFSNGYELKKVKLLVGIIYLNMAPLHHYPFDKLLYSLSNATLNRELNEDNK